MQSRRRGEFSCLEQRISPMVSFYIGKEDVGLASLQIIEKGLLVPLPVLDLVVDMSFGLL
jgi:hypothetical protein